MKTNEDINKNNMSTIEFERIVKKVEDLLGIKMEGINKQGSTVTRKDKFELSKEKAGIIDKIDKLWVIGKLGLEEASKFKKVVYQNYRILISIAPQPGKPGDDQEIMENEQNPFAGKNQINNNKSKTRIEREKEMNELNEEKKRLESEKQNRKDQTAKPSNKFKHNQSNKNDYVEEVEEELEEEQEHSMSM